MSMSVGASSNALAYLQQLLQQGTAGASSAGAADPLSELMQTLSGSGSDTDPLTSSTSTTAAGSGSTGTQPFGSDTMAQLLSVQNQSGKGPEQAFFSKLDTDGNGSISKSEFESAASKAGVDTSVADAVFDKIDGDGDGAVSSQELAKADHGGHHHVHGGGGGGGGGGADALMSGTDVAGATTTTTSNADGSTTTTIKYADGSSIDMNTPAATTSASASASSVSSGSDSSGSDSSNSNSSSQTTFNLLEQLIKMQSQMLSAMQASASTMSIAA